ncbi:MAG: hypothetical protein HKP27_16295 [Myxococcales bacterium]|nr:hypothetical protein [Myxococcales bacterium]
MSREATVASHFETILRGFEHVQENLLFHRVGAAQTDLHTTVSEPLEALQALLAEAADDESAGLYRELREPVELLRDARDAFLRRDRDFTLSFFAMRRSFSRAVPLLYRLRRRLPSLTPYWFEASALARAEALETEQPGSEPVGLVAKERCAEHAEYALYVPESYTADRQWPLILCLHGGHGREDEYLWTWMRTAKSHAQFVLSAKSLDLTWAFGNPEADFGSVLSMLDDVAARYAIDRSRILLTGLSDGGTFTYLLGLRHAERFAALAPIAAAGFHPMIDMLLHEGAGKDRPIHIVHGVHDAIFPVATARVTHQLLERIGYAVTYRELPDWGHAYPYSIHENIVFPWYNAQIGE